LSFDAKVEFYRELYKPLNVELRLDARPNEEIDADFYYCIFDQIG